MKSWLKLSVSFFALCLLILGLIYMFGSDDLKEGIRSGESPVGQLESSSTLESPGTPEESK